jgi:arsenate reductase
MAEGFLRAWSEDRLDVRSAGLEPKQVIHPMATAVMYEIGIDIRNQSPKGVNTFLGRVVPRHVIFLCDEAEQRCPRIYPGVVDRLYWPFDDPAAFEGSEAAKLEKFRAVRDEIGARIKEWLDEL